jgi:hypothetical protein
VRCLPEEAYCRDTRPGTPVSTLPVTQDLAVSAWGFGEGVQLFAQLRGRAAWGNPELWPQADQPLELLAGYGQIERSWLLVRAGRQQKVSGLGFYSFDGVLVGVRPASVLSLEVYGGRSLLRGLNEPRTGGALRAIEELAPAQSGLLLGALARYRSDGPLSLSALYQVDLRTGGGAHAELAAVDGVLRMGAGALEGVLELDVAGGAVNEARLRARSAPLAGFALQAEVLRYRPYFELWTIWGAFSPVGFDEARAGARWAGERVPLLLRADVSFRSYGDDGSGNAFGAFRREGWGLSGSASWTPAAGWRVDGEARGDAGFGAAGRQGQLSLRRQFARGWVSAHGLAFQRLYEFRLDSGAAYGAGAEASWQLTERAQVFAGGTFYRHRGSSSDNPDWTQRRATVRLQWLVGSEPAYAAPGGAP